MTQIAGPARLSALTSIRFFFAAMVMVAHFGGHHPDTAHLWPSFTFQMGQYAVSWFFMLSGFIIAYNYPTLPDNQARRNFLISRIARLWPVHLVTLSAAVMLFDERRWLFWQATLTQTWFTHAGAANAYNGPSWSVSNEIFFYLTYVVLLLPARWQRASAIVLPLVIAAALITWNDCWSVTGTANCNATVYQFPPSRLIEFLAGVALFHWRPKIPQVVGLAVFAAIFLNLMPAPQTQSVPLQLLVRQVEIIIAGGALITALSHDGWLSSLLSVKPLVVGGEISYSIYMTHQLVMLALLPRMPAINLTTEFVIVAGITLALSAALFYVVERPVRDAAKSWMRTGRIMAMPLTPAARPR
jgi:peptidoglycan/LPS O-acetylase OafA/YrhL